jgi:hypothetical protein
VYYNAAVSSEMRPSAVLLLLVNTTGLLVRMRAVCGDVTSALQQLLLQQDMQPGMLEHTPAFISAANMATGLLRLWRNLGWYVWGRGLLACPHASPTALPGEPLLAGGAAQCSQMLQVSPILKQQGSLFQP